MFSQYRGLRKEIYVLCFGRVVTNMGAMVWPMLTMILSQKMHLGAGTISLLLAAASVLMLPVNLLGGRLADRCNKRNIIVICDLISIVCYLICALIPLTFLSLGLMFAAAVCQSMEWPAYSALIADLTKTDDRERAYSLSYLGGNLGLVLSPTIAGLLFENHLWLCFLISSISIACSTVLIFLLIRDVHAETEETEAASYQTVREGASLLNILRERPLLILFVVLFGLYSGVYMQFNVLMPLELGRLHAARGALIFGSITSTNCIVVVFFTPLITRLTACLPEPRKMLAGNLLILSGFGVFLLFAGRIPFYYLSMVIFTWGEIVMMLADSPYTASRVPANHRGRINGLNAVSQALIGAVCQLLVGQLYERIAPGAGWAAVFGMGAVLIALTLVLIRRDRLAFPKLYR